MKRNRQILQKIYLACLVMTTCWAAVQSGSSRQFTSATIKAAPGASPTAGPGEVRFQNDGKVTAEKALLGVLVQAAYGMQPFQVSGGPDWKERWDLDATAPAGSTPEQMRAMMQTLLQDRFKLKVHRETRDTHVYELTIVPGGLKTPQPLRPCRQPGSMPPPPPPPPEPGKTLPPPQPVCGAIYLNLNSLTEAHLVAGQITVTQLVGVLSNALGGAVIDKTNLDTKMDLSVSFTPDAALAGIPFPSSRPLPAVGDGSIFTALEQQAGLKLTGAHNVEILIIDYAEKPSGNRRY